MVYFLNPRIRALKYNKPFNTVHTNVCKIQYQLCPHNYSIDNNNNKHNKEIYHWYSSSSICHNNITNNFSDNNNKKSPEEETMKRLHSQRQQR